MHILNERTMQSAIGQKINMLHYSPVYLVFYLAPLSWTFEQFYRLLTAVRFLIHLERLVLKPINFSFFFSELKERSDTIKTGVVVTVV